MKNNNTSVTVIVPVYNVAPYIEKCARSLFEQTLEDLAQLQHLIGVKWLFSRLDSFFHGRRGYYRFY